MAKSNHKFWRIAVFFLLSLSFFLSVKGPGLDGLIVWALEKGSQKSFSDSYDTFSWLSYTNSQPKSGGIITLSNLVAWEKIKM